MSSTLPQANIVVQLETAPVAAIALVVTTGGAATSRSFYTAHAAKELAAALLAAADRLGELQRAPDPVAVDEGRAQLGGWLAELALLPRSLAFPAIVSERFRELAAHVVDHLTVTSSSAPSDDSLAIRAVEQCGDGLRRADDHQAADGCMRISEWLIWKSGHAGTA